ncbi:SMC family ATPase, partial [Streptomyces sp. SID3343]|uniref:AAA family ATPase n=1 Tax=Streptomyces sp. SID3343 TaxID=2690260 RepID=UPI00136FA881
MRPITLTFSGLRSFPGTCGPLDFTGKKLVGILGDTGAGKSTVLEAMTAALYGKCSWSEVGVGQLISEGSATMSVDFVFSVGGESWRVRRAFHADTKPTQALLENLRTGTAIDNVGSVNRRIVQLLKLDYKSFKTAVLLPQGRFDALLNATDAERTAMLKSIFGVDEVQRIRSRSEVARDRLAQLNHDAETALARLLDDPIQAADEAEGDEHRATERAERLHERLRTLRARQEEAIAAREHARATAAADAMLAAHRVDDAHAA